MSFLRIFSSVLLACGLTAAVGCVDPTHVEEGWTSLGLPASAELYTLSDRSARALLDEFPLAMRRVESMMSLSDPESELNRLNETAGSQYYRVNDRDLYRCISLALDYAKVSDGAYDPTIGPLTNLYERARPDLPQAAEIKRLLQHVGWSRVTQESEALAVRFASEEMRLDLAGAVEGYALDVAARKFVRTGSIAGLLRLGNHAYAWGKPPGRQGWTVALIDPRHEGRELARVRLESSRGIGISASGDPRERVLDPRTGRPAAGDAAVVIALADSATDAVLVSRALLAGGSSRGGLLLGKTRRVEAILVTGEPGSPSVIASGSLRGRLELVGELSGVEPRFLLPPSEP